MQYVNEIGEVEGPQFTGPWSSDFVYNKHVEKVGGTFEDQGVSCQVEAVEPSRKNNGLVRRHVAPLIDVF